MWIKTKCGLFNLDKATEITLSQEPRLNLWVVRLNGLGAFIGDKEDAQKVFDKLAEKLEAEKID